jgi:hypothetical protein
MEEHRSQTFIDGELSRVRPLCYHRDKNHIFASVPEKRKRYSDKVTDRKHIEER